MNLSRDLPVLNSKSPAFSIVIEGKGVMTVMDAHLMSLTLTDNRGFEADQFDLELDDADGMSVLPRRGCDSPDAGMKRPVAVSERGTYRG